MGVGFSSSQREPLIAAVTQRDMLGFMNYYTVGLNRSSLNDPNPFTTDCSRVFSVATKCDMQLMFISYFKLIQFFS